MKETKKSIKHFKVYIFKFQSYKCTPSTFDKRSYEIPISEWIINAHLQFMKIG